MSVKVIMRLMKNNRESLYVLFFTCGYRDIYYCGIAFYQISLSIQGLTAPFAI